MDSPSVATVATSLAAEATEAGSAEAAVVVGLRSVVAAVVEALSSVVAAVVVGRGSVIGTVVESLGDGGLSDTEALASSEGNSLRCGSSGGESSSESASLTDELTLLETDDGCLGGTTWDSLAAAESLDRSVRSAGGIEASSDELTTDLLESVTS
jgi:hypothetical protein